MTSMTCDLASSAYDLGWRTALAKDAVGVRLSASAASDSAALEVRLRDVAARIVRGSGIAPCDGIDVRVAREAGGDAVLQAPSALFDVESLMIAVREAQVLLDSADDVLDFAAVVEWRQALAADPDCAEDRRYWRAVLDTLIDDRGSASANGAAAVHHLAVAMVDLDVSDDAVLMVAWRRVLRRRFGHREHALGWYVDGRDGEGLDAVLGPLALCVPLLPASAAAGDPVEVARRQMADARERVPLFPTLADDGARMRFGFASHRLPAGVLDLHAPHGHALLLRALHGERGTAVRLEYDARTFDAADMTWLARQLSVELRRLTRTEALGPVDDAEHAWVRAAIDTKERAEAAPDMLQCLQRVVDALPDADALQAGSIRLTHADLARWSNRIARFLMAEGARPGDRIAVCMPRSARQLATLLAVLKAGAAFVPLDPTHPAPRIARLLRSAAATMVVTELACIDRVSEGDVEVPIIDWDRDSDYIESFDAEPLQTAVHPEHEAYVIFTSGSTGEPKGVAVPHRALANYVAALGCRIDFSSVRSMAALSTVAADLGYTAVFGALCNGACVRVLDEALSLDAAALAAALDREPVDALKIVPSHLSALIEVERPERVLPLRVLVLGGEAASPRLLSRVHALAPTLIVANHYGPTETTVGVTCRAGVTAADGALPGIPLGAAMPGNRLHLLDGDGAACGVGVDGQMFLAGRQVAHGYLGQPAATALAFVPDPFSDEPGARMYASGDRARVDAHGRLLYLGRADRQVKIRGHRVEPAEIESLLRASSLARDVVVLVDDAAGGARLLAFVADADASSVVALQALAATELPEPMRPSQWVAIEQMPLNRNGKLDRAALMALAERQNAPERAASPIERELCALCEALLGGRQVGVDDSFFAIGLDSIVAIQLVARARQRGLHFKPKDVLTQASVARLAEVVERRALADAAHCGGIDGTVPLTAIQSRFFARVTCDPHHYNQAFVYDLPIGSTLSDITRAMSAVLREHDGLRARFERGSDGRWTQTIEPWVPALAEACCVTLRLATPAGFAERIAAEQASLQLDRAPLLRALLVEADGWVQPRLLLVIHHLLVDAYSWRVLEDDFGQLLADPEVGLPARTASLREWAGAQQRRTEQPEWIAEQAHWASRPRTAMLPMATKDAGTAHSADHRTLEIADEGAAGLGSEVHAAFNTNDQDLLLAALLLTVTDITGGDALDVMLEAHGRDAHEGLAFDRTVGWFTAMFPLRLVRPASGTPVDLVKSVKEQLRAVPGGGHGYLIDRYLMAQGRAVEDDEPAICFNYLGRVNSDGAPQHGRLRPSTDAVMAQQATRSTRQARLFPIEILAVHVDGKLRLNLVYHPPQVGAARIDALLEGLQQRLAELVAACRTSGGGLTPSDVPDLDLPQHELDALLVEIDTLV